MATLAIFANVLGLILFLDGRTERLLAAVVDPLHPDWMGMERAFAGFTIYAASLLGAVAIGILLLARAVVRRVRARRANNQEGTAPSLGLAPTLGLAVTLTAAVVLVFIEVLIFQDYGIHFYEFDVFGILADAALRRDLGIQPAEVARVTAAAIGLLAAEIALCLAAVRLVRWRDGALPRACGAAMLVAIPGGFAMFRASEDRIGPIRSEFEGVLPLGRQLLLRADSRPHIAVEPRTGPGGYPVAGPGNSAPRMQRRPNIVFYVPDGLRADMVRPELTPNLLALASQPHSISSRRHFSTGHVSEAGIFGLVYSLRSHAFNAFIEDRIPAYPMEVLRRNGYHTFFISSSRLNPYPSDQLIRSFDEVVFPANDDEAIEEMRRYLHERKADGRPYFMLAFMYTPHYPFTSAKPHLRRYPMVGPKARSNYMNDVIQADDYLRQSLAMIDSAAVVAVTSDHGEEIRDHGGFGHASATFWNVKVQVPLVIRLPGAEVEARFRRPALTAHPDLWPTIFDYTGTTPALDPSSYSDGQSLLRHLGQIPAVVTGRFFPAADRPSAVIDGQRKFWIRASRVGADTALCLEASRVTDMYDQPLHDEARAPLSGATSIAEFQRTFWRFLRYVGPPQPPCAVTLSSRPW